MPTERAGGKGGGGGGGGGRDGEGRGIQEIEGIVVGLGEFLAICPDEENTCIFWKRGWSSSCSFCWTSPSRKTNSPLAPDSWRQEEQQSLLSEDQVAFVRKVLARLVSKVRMAYAESRDTRDPQELWRGRR